MALAALGARAPAGPADRCRCRTRRAGPDAVRTGPARQPPGRCAGGRDPTQRPGGAAGAGRTCGRRPHGRGDAADSPDRRQCRRHRPYRCRGGWRRRRPRRLSARRYRTAALAGAGPGTGRSACRRGTWPARSRPGRGLALPVAPRRLRARALRRPARAAATGVLCRRARWARGRRDAAWPPHRGRHDGQRHRASPADPDHPRVLDERQRIPGQHRLDALQHSRSTCCRTPGSTPSAACWWRCA